MKRALSISMMLAAASAMASVGCSEPSGTSPGAAPGSSAAAAAVQESDLKTPTDYADEAEKDISPANYKSELDTIEKEIDTQK